MHMTISLRAFVWREYSEQVRLCFTIRLLSSGSHNRSPALPSNDHLCGYPAPVVRTTSDTQPSPFHMHFADHINISLSFDTRTFAILALPPQRQVRKFGTFCLLRVKMWKKTMIWSMSCLCYVYAQPSY